MNYTFKFDPQQKWGTVVNDSYPLDYEDHFYISVAPKKAPLSVQYLNNLLNTKAQIEMNMTYDNLYEYAPPPVKVIK